MEQTVDVRPELDDYFIITGTIINVHEHAAFGARFIRNRTIDLVLGHYSANNVIVSYNPLSLSLLDPVITSRQRCRTAHCHKGYKLVYSSYPSDDREIAGGKIDRPNTCSANYKTGTISTIKPKYNSMVQVQVEIGEMM